MKVNINEIKKRKLKEFYVSVYLVKYPMPYRSDNIINKRNVYIMYGVDIYANRQILDIFFENNYDNRFWLEKFEEIKSRNVNEIMFLITSENKHIEKAIKILYNNTILIDSALDIINDFGRFVPYKRSNDVGEILKKLFIAESIDNYNFELNIIKEKYSEYTLGLLTLEKQLKKIEKYYNYDYELRRLFLLYYTNRDMQFKLRKVSNKNEYYDNINMIITELLEYINSFENGKSYSKKEWNVLTNCLYKNYPDKAERYV